MENITRKQITSFNIIIIINETTYISLQLHIHRRRVQRVINCRNVHLAHISNVITRQRLQIVLLGQLTAHSVLVTIINKNIRIKIKFQIIAGGQQKQILTFANPDCSPDSDRRPISSQLP